MKREVQKYPYNVITKDEIKTFLSDKICQQVVSITYKNGQIFYTIKVKITDKKKIITFSVALIFGVLFGMPKEARPMGFTRRVTSVPKIHRPAPPYFHQHALTVTPRLDKIRFITNHKMIPVIYMDRYNGSGYINLELLKKLRCGNNFSTTLTLIAIGGVVYIICQVSGVDGFSIFDQIGQWNAPPLSPQFGTVSSPSSTEIALIPTKEEKFNMRENFLKSYNRRKSEN